MTRDDHRPTTPTPTPPRKARSKIKCGKAAGPSGIIIGMLKAAGDEGAELGETLVEAVFSIGMISVDWEESLILNLYGGKGGALVCGNYRGLKLTDKSWTCWNEN